MYIVCSDFSLRIQKSTNPNSRKWMKQPAFVYVVIRSSYGHKLYFVSCSGIQASINVHDTIVTDSAVGVQYSYKHPSSVVGHSSYTSGVR